MNGALQRGEPLIELPFDDQNGRLVGKLFQQYVKDCRDAGWPLAQLQ